MTEQTREKESEMEKGRERPWEREKRGGERKWEAKHCSTKNLKYLFFLNLVTYIRRRQSAFFRHMMKVSNGYKWQNCKNTKNKKKLTGGKSKQHYHDQMFVFSKNWQKTLKATTTPQKGRIKLSLTNTRETEREREKTESPR